MDWKYSVGDEVYFNCIDLDWHDTRDIPCRVKRRMTSDEADLEVTGPMYELAMLVGPYRIEVGSIPAFEDELTAAPTNE